VEKNSIGLHLPPLWQRRGRCLVKRRVTMAELLIALLAFMSGFLLGKYRPTYFQELFIKLKEVLEKSWKN
jgi:hypothetical protein